ncbi:MAG TPA: extracellular solute-binding protein [Chloroflexota bacterium]|nr:extracellular solute-binding protein [Chloroflexota bacterium]
MISRRLALRSATALLSLTAGGASAACGQDSTGGPAALAKGPVTIRAFIGGIGAALIDRWEPEIAAPLKQRVPNLTLELLSQAAMTDGSTADVVQKFTAMLAGGDPPDVNDLPRPAAQQVELGFLDERIDSFIRRDKVDTKQFNQREFEQKAVYKGKMWQLPYKYLSNALVVVYNRQSFQAAGVPFPDVDPARTWDWDAHLQAMTKLTTRGADGKTARFGMAHEASATYTWPRMFQADYVSQDGKTALCDSPAMQEAYTKWADLMHKYNVVPRPGEARDLFGTSAASQLFLTGKAATSIMSPGNWSLYITNNSQFTDIGLAPLPKGKVSTPDIGSTCLGIVKGSRHPAEAWETIKHLVEGSRLAVFARYLPAIPKDVEPWAREDLKRFPQADVKAVLRSLETHDRAGYLSGHPRQDEMLRSVSPALDAIKSGKEGPVAVLRRLKLELQGIIDRP